MASAAAHESSILLAAIAFTFVSMLIVTLWWIMRSATKHARSYVDGIAGEQIAAFKREHKKKCARNNLILHAVLSGATGAMWHKVPPGASPWGTVNKLPLRYIVVDGNIVVFHRDRAEACKDILARRVPRADGHVAGPMDTEMCRAKQVLLGRVNESLHKEMQQLAIVPSVGAYRKYIYVLPDIPQRDHSALSMEERPTLTHICNDQNTPREILVQLSAALHDAVVMVAGPY